MDSSLNADSLTIPSVELGLFRRTRLDGGGSSLWILGMLAETRAFSGGIPASSSYAADNYI